MQTSNPRSAAAASLMLSLALVVLVATAIGGPASTLLFTIVASAIVPGFLLQRIANAARALGFPEALHFSITTLSTVGYGDIVPASSVGRSLAEMQVIMGTLLLLFGVSEISEYSRERRRQRGG